MIEPGEPAPDFTVPNQDGEEVTLSQLRGRHVVLAISPDPVEDLRAFADKYGLPFTLLADEGAEVSKRYGVWTDHTERTTFLIDPDGVVARVFPQVRPAGHDDLVLGALAELTAPA